MTEQLVSVIIPVYNVEKYIDRCIKSLINQSYANLEIILVDDGSPDNCGVICDKWAARDGRIKVIHKENGGLSDARNAGIEASTGDFIFFLDGDDYLDLQTFAGLYKRYSETKADIVMCNFQYVDDDGKSLYKNHTRATEAILSNIEALAKLSNISDTINFTISCSKMIKKELFEEIRFPVGKVNEDEFTTYKLFWKANKIAVMSEPYYKYVQRTTSIMGTKISVKRFDGIEAMCQRYSFYKTQGLTQLLPDMEILLRQVYCNLRRRFYLLTSDKADRARICQVDKMYRNVILHSLNISLPAKLIYAYCPHLVYHWSILKKAISKGCYLVYFAITANLAKKVVINPQHIGSQENIFARFLSGNCQVIINANDFLGDKWADRESQFKRLVLTFGTKAQLHLKATGRDEEKILVEIMSPLGVDYKIDIPS